MKQVSSNWYNAACNVNNKPFLLYAGWFDIHDLDQATKTAIQAMFSTETIAERTYAIVRLSNTLTDITNVSFQNNLSHDTWLGNGWLQEPTQPVDDDSLSSSDAEIVLTGVDPVVVSLVLGSLSVGAKGEVYLGFIVENNKYATKIWEGVFSSANVTNKPEGIECTLYYESELLELERPKNNRYNNETQKYYYPNDTGFQYLEALQEKTFQFGPTKEQVDDRNRKAEQKAKRKAAKKAKAKNKKKN